MFWDRRFTAVINVGYSIVQRVHCFTYSFFEGKSYSIGLYIIFFSVLIVFATNDVVLFFFGAGGGVGGY